MYKAYLCKSITLNCVKLSLLTNWVKGKFNYSSIQAHNTGILQMCLFGNYLATAGADRTCKLYDIVTRTCLKVFKGHEKCILCIKMDGKKVKKKKKKFLNYIKKKKKKKKKFLIIKF